MEICDDFLEENDRYAFLLGVALRNQDTQQFLEVYDKVLPKNLTEEEINWIKERARWLSTREEDEFSAYASRARQYSLAQPSAAEMCDEEQLARIETLRNTATVGKVQNCGNGHFLAGPLESRYGLSRTSRHFGPNSGSISDASDSGIGLGGSLKYGSTSDADQEEYERPGVFDYHQTSVRPAPATAVTSQGRIHKHTTEYNPCDSEEWSIGEPAKRRGKEEEEEEGLTIPLLRDSKFKFDKTYTDHTNNHKECGVEMVQITHNDEQEHVTVASPSEMKAHRKDMRKKHNEMFDEAYLVEGGDGSVQDSGGSSEEFPMGSDKQRSESDDDLRNVIVHDRLYGQNGDYRPSFVNMEDDMADDYDCDVDDDDMTSAHRSLSRHKTFNGSFVPNSFTRNSVNTFSQRRDYGTTMERPGGSYEREVRFLSSSDYSASRSYAATTNSVCADRGINFGLKSSNVKVEKSESINRTSLDKPAFGSSLNRKEFTKKTMGLIDNSDWRSRTVDNMPEGVPISQEGVGKRKKKRNNKKDDESSKTQDINGNPLELGQARNNKAVGESYTRPKYDFEENSRAEERSKFPGNVTALEQYVTERERDAVLDTGSQLFKEKKARKLKKKEPESIKASSIPGNQGFKDIDELIHFIEDSNGTKSAAKTPTKKTPNGPQSSASPPKETVAVSTGATAKESKKQKRKKNGSISAASGAGGNKEAALDNTSDGSSVSDLKEVTVVSNADKSPSPTEVDLDRVAKAVFGSSDHVRNDKIKHVTQDNDMLTTRNDYIFTDFELPKPPQEEEFQTVSSKKKKRYQNHSGGFDGVQESAHQRESRTFYRHRDAVSGHRTRAYTPPPTTSRTSGDAVRGGRAFSPCAFPVLVRSGRRYSTGTAEFEAENAESDSESSVSVPAGERGSKSDTAASSSAGSSQPANLNLPFTYAKAASRHPRENASKTVDSPDDLDKSSGMGERRHSLGNINMLDMAPLENFKDSAVHKSQEIITSRANTTSYCLSISSAQDSKDSSLSTSKFSSAENVSREAGGTQTQDVVVPNPQSDADFPQLPLHVDTTRKNADTTPVPKDSYSKDTSVNISSLVFQSPTIVNAATTGISRTTPAPQKQWREVAGQKNKHNAMMASSSSSDHSSKPSSKNSNKMLSKNVDTAVKRTIHNNAPSKVKCKNNVKTNSVVFLDKKFETRTRDFEISFGFDDELENLTNEQSKQTIETSSQPDSFKVSPTNVCSKAQEIATDSGEEKAGSSGAASGSAICTSTVTENKSDEKNVISNLNPVLPPNGLVTPEGVKVKSQESQTVPAEDASSDPDGMLSKVKGKRYELPSREDDPNYEAGNFDQPRAVQMLYEAWMRVVEDVEKSSQDLYYKDE